MITKNPRDPEKTPREEPAKQDPIKPYKEPDLNPGKNNPINPKIDEPHDQSKIKNPVQDDPANQNSG